jgi:tRNA(Ile2) C34 agmatinyltransferase TiaS
MIRAVKNYDVTPRCPLCNGDCLASSGQKLGFCVHCCGRVHNYYEPHMVVLTDEMTVSPPTMEDIIKFIKNGKKK